MHRAACFCQGTSLRLLHGASCLADPHISSCVSHIETAFIRSEVSYVIKTGPPKDSSVFFLSW